jgi:predicted metal-binding protein
MSRDVPPAGQALWDAVQAASDAQPLAAGITLRGIACLNSCSRACTVALQAAGKHSYCFGDLQADATTAAQVLACALQHLHSSDGNLPRNERPERLRGGILLRLPPMLPQGHGAVPGSSATVQPIAAAVPQP